MRTITLALVVAFAAATRLTALDANLDKTVKPIEVKPVDTKPVIGDIKPIEKPVDITLPGETKKVETLEDSKEGSKSFGGCD